MTGPVPLPLGDMAVSVHESRVGRAAVPVILDMGR
jgi:hypothetical protein